MLKVFKYEVPISDFATVDMPQGAKILSLQVQHGTPTIWALVDPEAPSTQRNFRVAGTGHAIDNFGDELSFVGTCQMMDGSLVWHLFELV